MQTTPSCGLVAAVQVFAVEEPQAVVVPAAHVSSFERNGFPPMESVWEDGFEFMMVTGGTGE